MPGLPAVHGHAPGLLLGLLAISTLVAGCAQLPADAGFAQVREDVARRVSHAPVWNRTPEQTRAAADRVTRLLGQTLTAAGAVEVALLNNAALQAEYAQLGVSQAAAVQAGLLRNPMLHAAVLYPRDGDPAVLDYALGFDLLGLLSRGPRLQAAASEHEQVRLRAAATTLDLIGRARGAWYDLMTAREGLDRLRDMAEAALLADEVARRLHAAGNLTDLRRGQAMAQRQAAELELQAAEDRAWEARRALLIVLGLPADTALLLPERLPRLPLEEPPAPDAEAALAASLELAMGRAALAQAESLAGLSRVTGPIQELELGYAWERDDGKWKDGPSLGLALPIFDTGAARRAAAQARVEGLRAQLEASRQAVLAEAERLRTGLTRTRGRVDYLRDQLLPLNERLLEDALLEYNAMQKSAFDLLDLRRRELAGVRLLLEALNDYWQTRVRAELLAAGRLPQAPISMGTTTAALPSAASTGGH